MLKVTVEFPEGFPYQEGPYLLTMEKYLRAGQFYVQVLKRLKGDDSQLRRLMTPEQRERL